MEYLKDIGVTDEFREYVNSLSESEDYENVLDEKDILEYGSPSEIIQNTYEGLQKEFGTINESSNEKNIFNSVDSETNLYRKLSRFVVEEEEDETIFEDDTEEEYPVDEVMDDLMEDTEEDEIEDMEEIEDEFLDDIIDEDENEDIYDEEEQNYESTVEDVWDDMLDEEDYIEEEQVLESSIESVWDNMLEDEEDLTTFDGRYLEEMEEYPYGLSPEELGVAPDDLDGGMLYDGIFEDDIEDEEDESSYMEDVEDAFSEMLEDDEDDIDDEDDMLEDDEDYEEVYDSSEDVFDSMLDDEDDMLKDDEDYEEVHDSSEDVFDSMLDDEDGMFNDYEETEEDELFPSSGTASTSVSVANSNRSTDSTSLLEDYDFRMAEGLQKVTISGLLKARKAGRALKNKIKECE